MAMPQTHPITDTSYMAACWLLPSLYTMIVCFYATWVYVNAATNLLLA